MKDASGNNGSVQTNGILYLFLVTLVVLTRNIYCEKPPHPLSLFLGAGQLPFIYSNGINKGKLRANALFSIHIKRTR